MTFLNHRYEKLLRLDSITCVVDAEAVFTHGDDAYLSSLKMRQIGFADMIILNKIDLVDSDHIEVIREWIGHYLNRIRIIEATHCLVPLEVLLAVGRFDPLQLSSQYEGPDAQGHDIYHGHGAISQVFKTWSYESSQPFSLEVLRKMVQLELPASIYRCKGIIYAADSPNTRLALQIVGRRTEITELDDWGQRKPYTQIVAIGSSIDTGELNRKFDACIKQQSLALD